MKVAVFFSGRINGYEDCLETIYQLVTDYDPVFFVSLNDDTLNEYYQTFFDNFNIKEGQYNIEKTVLPDKLKDDNLLIYPNDLIKYNEDGSEYISFENLGDKVVISNGIKSYNLYSMFYHRLKCIQLIMNYQDKHAFKFDTIVSFRADIYKTSPLKLDYPLKNTIYGPVCDTKDQFLKINNDVNYGDYESMLRFCSLVLNYINLYYVTRIIHPEYLVYRYLKLHSIDIVEFNYEYTLNIKRMQYIEPKKI